jgi:hypothetical protein
VEADQAADHLRGGGGAAGVHQERLGGRGAEIAGGAVIAQEGLDLVEKKSVGSKSAWGRTFVFRRDASD